MPSYISKTSSLQQLQMLFPHAVAIDGKSLALALGFKGKTIDNQGELFPIRCVRLGRNKRYRLADIAAFMDAALGLADDQGDAPAVEAAMTAAPPAVKRRPGRPPKKAAARARSAS